MKSAGLQRSSSDAGRDRLGDAKKPPSGIARPSTSGSFGYKKPPPATGTATVVQTGGSATLGKVQKSSGIPVKPANGRKTSLDVPNSAEPGFLAPGARSNIQYRSLPRPAKSSSMSVTGGRAGPWPVSSSIDPSLLSTRQGSLTPSRLKEPSKGGRRAGHPSPRQPDGPGEGEGQGQGRGPGPRQRVPEEHGLPREHAQGPSEPLPGPQVGRAAANPPQVPRLGASSCLRARHPPRVLALLRRGGPSPAAPGPPPCSPGAGRLFRLSELFSVPPDVL